MKRFYYGIANIIFVIFSNLKKKSLDYYYKDWSVKMEVDLNAVYIGFSIIRLITSILLIVSVKKRMSNMAIPWLVETALAIVACFCSSILLAKSLPMAPILLLASGNNSFHDYLIYFCVILMTNFLFWKYIVLSVYFWLAVLRFHLELKLEEQNKQSARANENINMESVNVNSGIV